MPAKPKPDVDVDALTSQVHESIDAIKAAVEKGDAQLATVFAKQAEANIVKLPAGKRTALRNAVRSAQKPPAQAKAKPTAAPTPSTEVAKNTDDPMTWDNVPQLIAAGAQKMREGASAGLEVQNAGGLVANVLLTIRQNIIDPETGLPDLTWRTKAARSAAGRVYSDALAGVEEDNIPLRDALAALQTATHNKASDVLVTWLRGYDRDDEKSVGMLGELLPGAVEILKKSDAERDAKLSDPDVDGENVPEPMTAEEAIRALYASKNITLPLRGRTEAMRVNRRVAKIEKARKQLEGHQDAGNTAKAEAVQAEINDLLADLPPDAVAKLGEGDEKTDAQRTVETVAKVRKMFETAGKRQKKLTAAQKRKTKAELYTLIREVVDTFGLDYSALVPEDTEGDGSGK
ncbi:hypothetical protein [Streptomyces sp. NPDC008125]|uniref:hypothetical protein n=1 Tax=Streptomyces sp. NPDC008125 TaxID=3364811 RepID=UPI0036EDDE82